MKATRPIVVYDPRVDKDNYPGEYSDSGESGDDAASGSNSEEEDSESTAA